MGIDNFNLFFVATVEDREVFNFDEFFKSVGISLEEPNKGIYSFSSPELGSSSRTCNICFCRLDMGDFDSPVDYAEAMNDATDRCCDWLEEHSHALRVAHDRLRYVIYVEKTLSNRSGITFPPALVRVCADLNMTLDFDLYNGL